MTDVDARSAVAAASSLLAEFSGKRVVGVTSVQKTDGGWKVELELIEASRVPSSQDLVGSYAVELDDAGNLIGFEQVSRYIRGAERGSGMSIVPRSEPAGPLQSAGRDSGNLGDILERVLDKGIVIAGDIRVNLLDIELLTIKLRLVIASLETAKEVGIDWWERDPWRGGGKARELEAENRQLRDRIAALEERDHD